MGVSKFTQTVKVGQTYTITATVHHKENRYGKYNMLKRVVIVEND